MYNFHRPISNSFITAPPLIGNKAGENVWAGLSATQLPTLEARQTPASHIANGRLPTLCNTKSPFHSQHRCRALHFPSVCTDSQAGSFSRTKCSLPCPSGLFPVKKCLFYHSFSLLGLVQGKPAVWSSTSFHGPCPHMHLCSVLWAARSHQHPSKTPW